MGRWTASYSGNRSNNPAATNCGDESVAVGPHLYWTDFAAGTVMEANLDGSNPHVIVSGQNEPDGVAVNSSNLYWADFGGDTVNEANLDGSSPQTIASLQNNPAYVAVGP
jgi:hypothetical protein